jgi:transmembrane sensor
MSEELYGLSDDTFLMGNIIRKYTRQETSTEEQALLDNWIARSEENKKFFDELIQKESLQAGLMAYHEFEANKEVAGNKMMEMTFPEEGIVRRMGWNWRRIVAAAAIVLFVATGVLLLLRGRDKKTAPVAQTEKKKITIDKAPGKDGAILTLANGEKLILDNAANGLISQQGKTEVLKKDGVLSYSPKAGRAPGEVLYNTLSTPRGRQFQLRLPDGSRLWLNAASSVRYPTEFASTARVIEIINGEAYLEIATVVSKAGHEKVPFIVKANDMQIEVLGTEFNVKAYKEEANINTTLIQGKVKITRGSSVALLTPGKQAIIATTGRSWAIRVIENADTEEAIAWKNGLIAANRATIKEALMQISRWYDIDLVFKNEIKEEDIRIRVPRTASLASVLKIFELSSRMRFEVEGNKLIVWQQ